MPSQRPWNTQLRNWPKKLTGSFLRARNLVAWKDFSELLFSYIKQRHSYFQLLIMLNLISAKRYEHRKNIFVDFTLLNFVLNRINRMKDLFPAPAYKNCYFQNRFWQAFSLRSQSTRRVRPKLALKVRKEQNVLNMRRDAAPKNGRSVKTPANILFQWFCFLVSGSRPPLCKVTSLL